MAIGQLSLKPFYEEQAAAQGIEMNKQVMQENQMKLAQLQKAAQSKDYMDKLLASSAQDAFKEPPELSQSIMPGESGGMPTQAPQGFSGAPQPREGLTGLGGMQQGISGIEPTPEAKPEPTLGEKLSTGGQRLNQSQKIQKMYEDAIAKAAKDGKSDVVEELSKKLSTEKDNAYKNTKDFFANMKDSYEMQGRIGTGYLDAIKTNPAAEPAAWARAIAEAQLAGFPADKLVATKDPQQRAALAQQWQGQAEKSGDVIREKVAELNAQRAKEKEKNLNDWKEKNYKYKEQKDASDRELKMSQFEITQQGKLRKEHFDNLTKMIGIDQKDVTEMDNQIKQLQTEKSNIASLKDIINTKTGKAYTPDEIKEKGELLDAEIDDLRTNRSNAMDRVAAGQELLKAGGEKPVPAPAAASASPAIGTIVNGYKFKGGEPNKKENWEPVTTAQSKPTAKTVDPSDIAFVKNPMVTVQNLSHFVDGKNSMTLYKAYIDRLQSMPQTLEVTEELDRLRNKHDSLSDYILQKGKA